MPPHLSTNPQLKQRFERDARTISSLSHPNICALHDIGHQNGTDYLVMEYLEGESLAHRLDKGSLPAEQVLKYGIQIAETLDKAHRQGIVHRDLKPGNIVLTRSGAKQRLANQRLFSRRPWLNTAGAAQNSYVYESWGIVKSQTGTTANPFTYTARETAEAGLMFYRGPLLLPPNRQIHQRR